MTAFYSTSRRKTYAPDGKATERDDKAGTVTALPAIASHSAESTGATDCKQIFVEKRNSAARHLLECFIEMTRNLASSSGPIVDLSTRQKKPRTVPGLEFARERRGKSVTGDERAAKTVVHPQGDHIHILADPIDRTSNDGIHDRERVV